MFGALLVLMLTWAIGTPRYGAPDELAHTVKAYATAHGQLLGSTTPGTSPLIRTYQVPRSLVSGEPWCFASLPDVNAGCAVPNTDSTIAPYESSAATYPLPYYAVIGTTVRVLGATDSARAYRMVSIGLTAVVLTMGLFLFRKTFGRQSAIVLLACNPMAIFVVSSTNPAALEVSGMLVLWAFVGLLLSRDKPATRRDLLIASTIGASLIVVRPVALPWVVIACASYFILEWRPSHVARRQRIGDLGVAGIPIAVAVIVGAIWSRFAGVGLTDDKYVMEGSTVDLARVAIGRTALLFRQGFGNLGWLDTQLPTGIFALWIGVIACAASAVIFFGDRRTKLVLLGLAACWVVYPAAYATLARTPAVWQGRYNLPLLGGLAICALIAITRDQLGGLGRQLAGICAASFIVMEVVALHQSLRRFMVGAGGDILLRSPGWSPALSPWLLLVVNLAAALALALLMFGAPNRGASVVSP